MNTLSSVSKQSGAKQFMHGIQVLMARNYIDNLREEVRKGMREKAEQGTYPSRPPLGYRNNKQERTIEVDPENAPIAQLLFDLYSSGNYSLAKVGAALSARTGRRFPRWYVEKLLKNPFYCGVFVWEGKTYEGTHKQLITKNLFERVQGVLQGRNHPKHRSREFAFSGLLQCAYDNCMVTAEIKKEKYVYYHCTGYRGKCALPYFREEDLGIRLGQILKDIYIPDDVLEMLQTSFRNDLNRSEMLQKQERDRLTKQLSVIRSRMDQAYCDKLDGRITEEFWLRNTADWQQQEQQVLLALKAFDGTAPDRLLTASRILELANKTYFLYLSQKPEEKAKLLKMVLSNCTVDAASLSPTYRKPFDMIFNRAKTEEWCARGDSNTRPTDS